MLIVELAVLAISVIVLITALMVYIKTKKKSSEKYTAYKYLNAYNNVYAPPRPQYYDECPEYNKWVEDANRLGKVIVNECNKKHPNDPNCPRYLPWTPAPCST